MKTTEKVHELGGHSSMTPREVLEKSARLHAEYLDVLIIGFTTDSELLIRSSTMSNEDALWMLKAAEVEHTRNMVFNLRESKKQNDPQDQQGQQVLPFIKGDINGGSQPS